MLSFLLVSFWYSKTNTLKSGFKVLFYNRVGDLFFFIAIGLIIFVTGSDSLSASPILLEPWLASSVPADPAPSLRWLLAVAIIVVVLSKSAQFGFHIWLLEAMEAPLPASSLIHSATLVCAGVVLLTKAPMTVYLAGGVTTYLVVWSCATSCALSASALFNYDIKKVLAYSTGSHVSLMLALAVTSGVTCGYTYTLVHASSKVFIFLLFGFIIDANGGVRDIRRMGGFFRTTDLAVFGAVGASFLSSLPFFPLAVLKDGLAVSLMTGAWAMEFAAAILMLAALLNYLYMGRLFFKIFFGDLLSVRGTYFYAAVAGTDFRLAALKTTSAVLKISPTVVLILYIFLIESSVVAQLAADYAFPQIKLIDGFGSLITNAHLRYFGDSNSFFFFFLLLPSVFRVLR